MSNNALDKAIAWAGGVTRLAERLDIRHSNVCGWRISGVPYKHRIAIEQLTNGEIRAIDFSANSTVAQAASSESVEIITSGE